MKYAGTPPGIIKQKYRGVYVKFVNTFFRFSAGGKPPAPPLDKRKIYCITNMGMYRR